MSNNFNIFWSILEFIDFYDFFKFYSYDQTYLPDYITIVLSSLTNCPLCSSDQSIEDVFLPKSDLGDYPINRDYYTPLDALDLKKTNQSWIALLYCESAQGHGTSYRFYMWRNFKGQSTWKTALCNFPADDNIMIEENLQRILKFKQQVRN